MEGITEWRNQRNGFYVYRVHYLANPAKRSQAWKDEARKALPSANDWNREMEIDFSSFVGKPVFLNDYDPATMFVKCPVSPKVPIIRSWDFGYHHPAVSWSQFVDGVQLVVLQSDMGNDIDFRLYVRHVLHLGALYFPNREYADCCDRAGDFDRPTGDSEVKILRSEFGIYPVYKYFKVEYTIEEMRKLMHLTHRKQPCFLVNDTPSNQLLHDALRGGYHYAEASQNRPEKETPFQDHFYENIVDPVRYTVGNFLGRNPAWSGDIERLAMIDVPAERENVW